MECFLKWPMKEKHTRSCVDPHTCWRDSMSNLQHRNDTLHKISQKCRASASASYLGTFSASLMLAVQLAKQRQSSSCSPLLSGCTNLQYKFFLCLEVQQGRAWWSARQCHRTILLPYLRPTQLSHLRVVSIEVLLHLLHVVAPNSSLVLAMLEQDFLDRLEHLAHHQCEVGCHCNIDRKDVSQQKCDGQSYRSSAS